MRVHELRDLAPCECESLRRERDEARVDRDQFAEDVDALAREAERARRERDEARAALSMEDRVALDFQSQRDEALAERDALRVELDALRVELLETQHAIGEAWFAGGVDTPAAVRRKTAALERLAHDPR